MKIVSLNIGLPREVLWHGRIVTTGIFKQPVEGRVALRKLNLDGDRQADLTVHGGEYKAVYCYPVAHYGYWTRELPGRQLPMGMFGENLTTNGLLEDSVQIGDQFAVGSAEVIVTQPRLPCYKLGVRFQADCMVKRFLASGRTGFYLAVTREGEVGAGDEIKVIGRDRGLGRPRFASCGIAGELERVFPGTAGEGWVRSPAAESILRCQDGKAPCTAGLDSPLPSRLPTHL